MEKKDGALPVLVHTATADWTTKIGFTDKSSDWWEGYFKIHSSIGKDAHDDVNSEGIRGGMCNYGFTCTMQGDTRSQTSSNCC